MIKLSISGSSCSVTMSTGESLVAGTVGKTVSIDYGDDWAWTQELSPTAVTVVCTDGTNSKSCIGVTDSFIIPWECLQKSGRTLSVSVYGRTKSGDTITRQTATVTATIGTITAALAADNDSSYTPSATVVEQLTSAIQEKQAALVSGTNIKTVNNQSIVGSGNLNITAGSAGWGLISGDIADQEDLQTALATKQATLVSGTNVKTINNQSIVGSGNIDVSVGSVEWGDIGGTLSGQTDLQAALDNLQTGIDAKQATLVSGTNIKTINSINLLGSGNIEIQAGGGETPTWGGIGGTLADQTDLSTALAGKAASSHTHTIANVTNLQSTLDGKAASNHNHAASNITSGTLAVANGGTGQTSTQAALTALLSGNKMILTSSSYGTTLPAAGTAGRIFFKKVT